MTPQPAMTWGMWGNTLSALRLFGQEWGFSVLEFEIGTSEEEMQRQRVIANGRFLLVDREGS